MSKKYLKSYVKISLFKKTIQIARRRILVYFLAAMIIPITASISIYSNYSAKTMEEEIFKNMQVTVAQAKNNVDYRMEQAEEKMHKLNKNG